MTQCMVTKLVAHNMEVRCLRDRHDDQQHDWGALDARSESFNSPCQYCEGKATCVLRVSLIRKGEIEGIQLGRGHYGVITCEACGIIHATQALLAKDL